MLSLTAGSRTLEKVLRSIIDLCSDGRGSSCFVWLCGLGGLGGLNGDRDLVLFARVGKGCWEIKEKSCCESRNRHARLGGQPLELMLLRGGFRGGEHQPPGAWWASFQASLWLKLLGHYGVHGVRSSPQATDKKHP